MSESRAPTIDSIDDVTIIHLGPEYENLDESQLDELRIIILEAAETADPAKVVLDLSHTKFFGSAFIEILFRMWKLLTGRGGAFALSGLTPYCRDVVEVTHLNRLWPVYASSDEAIEKMSGANTGRAN